MAVCVPGGIARGPALAAALAGLLASGRVALAVVVTSPSGPNILPPPGYVGSWNGASAVAVGPQWALTARHVGGGLGAPLILNGESYTADRLVLNRSEDLELVHVDRPLPGWHQLAGPIAQGQSVILGGMGYRAGDPVPAGGGVAGYDWSGGLGEAWGANVIDMAGARLGIRFDDPAAGGVPGEAIYTLDDSGGGMFITGADGSLLLAGLATTLSSRFGLSQFGDWAYAVNLDPWSAWITAIVNPGVPVASSVEAPMPGTYTPPPPPPSAPGPGAVGTWSVAAALITIRRRRHR